MGEFEYFLQLGSSLESQNKNVMAYGAYAAASERADEKNRLVIDSFLPALHQNISSCSEERNQELAETLSAWIREGKAAEAFFCYQEVFARLNGLDWVDHHNAILYHCLRIWMEEACQGEPAWDLAGGNLVQMSEQYYQLKFIARRRLAGLCTVEEFAEFLFNHRISNIAAEYMMNTVYIKPQYQAKDWTGDDKVSYKGDIAFIIPVDNEELFQEAEFYIRHLQVPSGMSVEVVPVRGAASMAAAYNQGMSMSRAHYKVYMHQDVMLLDSKIIYELCEIFEDSEIGMVGVAGVERLPASGIWWENDGSGDYRNLYQDSVLNKGHTLHNRFEERYRQVEVIDGAFMAVQYDVPWREDIFHGWHFYDLSQCMEFQKKGYQVVVAGQPYGVWCLHEQNYNKRLGRTYHREKECFLHAYRNGYKGLPD